MPSKNNSGLVGWFLILFLVISFNIIFLSSPNHHQPECSSSSPAKHYSPFPTIDHYNNSTRINMSGCIDLDGAKIFCERNELYLMVPARTPHKYDLYLLSHPKNHIGTWSE